MITLLYPYNFTQVAALLIPRINSKLFVDNVAECSNPNTFTQGCWSCPFTPSQIGDDGDNGARRLTTARLWAWRRRSLSAIWRISTAFFFDFFMAGRQSTRSELVE